MANFKVEESDGLYSVEFTSDDGAFLCIKANATSNWNETSVFENLDCASDFFEQGAVGYSPNNSESALDGLELKTQEWKVMPLNVSEVTSSFFSDETVFPKGSVEFDNALLMKSVSHEWRSLRELKG